jgi:hypothetical protein
MYLCRECILFTKNNFNLSHACILCFSGPVKFPGALLVLFEMRQNDVSRYSEFKDIAISNSILSWIFIWGIRQNVSRCCAVLTSFMRNVLHEKRNKQLTFAQRQVVNMTFISIVAAGCKCKVKTFTSSSSISFPGSYLLWRKDPGRSWSRDLLKSSRFLINYLGFR